MKKWKTFILIALLIPFLFVTRILPVYSSFVYHRELEKAEEAVQQAPQVLLSLLEAEGEEMQQLAEDIISLREESFVASYVLPTKQHSAVIPRGRQDLLTTKIPHIQERLQSINTQSEMPLYMILSPGKDLFYYPEESCVFRYHIMLEDEVYCQVDLIFSSAWNSCKEMGPILDPFGSDLSLEIAENWYVVMLEPV